MIWNEVDGGQNLFEYKQGVCTRKNKLKLRENVEYEEFLFNLETVAFLKMTKFYAALQTRGCPRHQNHRICLE